MTKLLKVALSLLLSLSSLHPPHLRGRDDGLASVVTLLDHHLLGEEDLLSGDLHAQVTTGNLQGGGGHTLSGARYIVGYHAQVEGEDG